MTDLSAGGTFSAPKQSILTASSDMKRRNAAEARFRAYGVIAIAIALTTLAVMLFTILREAEYSGWIIVETDVTKKPSARESAVISRTSLQEWGV